MGIYIHRNLAKIGKTRIGYSKRLDGKNGCLSGCIQVLFLPFTILFSVVSLIFGGKKKASSSGSARITPEPQKATVPETTVPEETPEENAEKKKHPINLIIIFAAIVIFVLMFMIPTSEKPQDVPDPEETTAATAAETEPTRGVPVLELMTEAVTETEAEAKAETEPQTEAVTEKIAEAPKPKETEATKLQEPKTEIKQEQKPKEEKKSTERAVNATMYALYNVKARTTPADNSESIGTVNAGTAITVVSVDDATGWAKAKNGTGYIYILWQYLSKEKPHEPETEKAPQKQEEYALALSVTSPVDNNSMATLTAKGKPNTVYHISVYYSTKESGAQGLENKTSDENGNVSWTWKVGGNTKPGKHKITVYAKNNTKDSAEIEFETVK